MMIQDIVEYLSQNTSIDTTIYIDSLNYKYDHYIPIPTPTMSLTVSPTQTPTPTMTNTESVTPSMTESYTPTITKTNRLLNTIDIDNFKPTFSSSEMDNLCNVSMILKDENDDDISENVSVFVIDLQGTSEYIPDKTIITYDGDNEITYKVISTIGKNNDYVISNDGQTQIQPGFWSVTTLNILKSSLISPLFMCLYRGTFHALEYVSKNGVEPPVNIQSIQSNLYIPSGLVNDDSSTYYTYKIGTTVDVFGYFSGMMKYSESKFINLIEDVSPSIAFDVNVNDYAYNFILPIQIEMGNDNVSESFLSQNDVIILLDRDNNVRGIGSIYNSNTIYVQAHTNTTSIEQYTIKLYKHTSDHFANRSVITIDTIDIYTKNGLVYTEYAEISGINPIKIKIGEIDVLLKAPFDWFSLNVQTTNPTFGIYLSSVLQNMTSLKSQKGLIIKTSQGGYVGSLDSDAGIVINMTLNTFYMIRLISDSRLIFHGKSLNNTQVTYELIDGDNWISNPYDVSLSLNEYVQKFENGTILYGKDGISTMINSQWIGSINSIVPNKGYILNNNISETITFDVTHHENIQVEDKNTFDISLDNFPIVNSGNIEFIDSTSLHVNINGTIFECNTQSQFYYYDSDLKTMVPTVFESTNEISMQIDSQATAVKCKGILTYTFLNNNSQYDVLLSGYIDFFLKIGFDDPFTNETAKFKWMSEIAEYKNTLEHSGTFRIKNIR